MTSWTDYLYLTLVLALLGGLGFVAIILTQKFNDGLQATRDTLKKQGLDITSQGVSVKTNKTYDQERYFDDTQKNLINVVKAATFGTNEKKHSLADYTTHSHAAPKVPGQKKRFFGKTQATPLRAQ
jgi:hypothetical protein